MNREKREMTLHEFIKYRFTKERKKEVPGKAIIARALNVRQLFFGYV